MNGQMNNGFQNQYPGQFPNQMQQMQPNQKTVDPEKKKKLLKKVKWFGIFLVIFLVMFFGKRYIDFVTLDYKPTVNSSLGKYYMSGNSEDLKPLRELLVQYKGNAKIATKIQAYSYEQVGKWFTYINAKYQCNEENYNSCVTQLSEFKLLLDKLNLLYTVKGGGYYIISPSQYRSLKAEAEKKITTLTAISRNRSKYKNPQNADYIYQYRCNNASNCDNCRDGICKCIYYEEKTKGAKEPYEIECYKPETIEKR